MRRCRRLPTLYLCRHVGRMCIVDVHRFSASTGKWSFSIGKPKNSNNDLKTKNSNNETNEVRHGHVYIYLNIYIYIYINVYWYKAYSLRGTSLAHVAREGPHAAVTFSCQGMRRESGRWVGGG